MMRIRTKIIIYSMILVVLLNGVSFFLYHSSQKSIDQYNDILQRFFLLNDVTQKTNRVYQSLNAYLIEKTPEFLDDYQNHYQALQKEKIRLGQTIGVDNHDLMFKNYYNMIESFLDECTIVMDGFEKQDLQVYSSHLTDALKILRFIQETSLTIINEELTDYQTFYVNINKKNEYFQSMGISIFATTIMFGILFALMFSNGMTKPISLLSKAAREISKGNFDGEDVNISSKDEMKFLTETFNNMRHNIRRLIKEMNQKSELDKLLKEMELKSLQSQINPHFLFNTLNVISKTAYLEGSERTSDLINSVAALLRYNLRNLNKPTTLEEEVRIVKEYFFIQKARFGERVQFQTEIDQSCLSASIPSLTLQPLIENAFIHGIESMESGAVLGLKIFPSTENVIVEVSDNGVGMDEMTRVKLLQNDEEEIVGKNRSGHSTGLGTRNVSRRLELFYQQENLVDIISEVGKGTIVRLIIPCIKGEKGGGIVV